jgi:hypothetical protein
MIHAHTYLVTYLMPISQHTCTHFVSHLLTHLLAHLLTHPRYTYSVLYYLQIHFVQLLHDDKILFYENMLRRQLWY